MTALNRWQLSNASLSKSDHGHPVHDCLIVVHLCSDAVCLTRASCGANGCRAKRMDVWQRAVDTDRFNPAFRNDEWRSRITDGHPERVVLTYVGRLGAGMFDPPLSC